MGLMSHSELILGTGLRDLYGTYADQKRVC